jgi:hypothetical protein
VLPRMPDGMASMVRDAFPRTDLTSQGVALHAIASQEPFERLAQLSDMTISALVIPGGDPHHPRELGDRYQEVLARPLIIEVDMWTDVGDAQSFATRIAPALERFSTRSPSRTRQLSPSSGFDRPRRGQRHARCVAGPCSQARSHVPSSRRPSFATLDREVAGYQFGLFTAATDRRRRRAGLGRFRRRR